MKDLVSVYEFQRLILNVEFFLKIFFRKWIRNVRVKIQVFCQHEVDLETYVLIGEVSLTCTQSTITPGVHLTFKIARLKNLLPYQKC